MIVLWFQGIMSIQIIVYDHTQKLPVCFRNVFSFDENNIPIYADF